MNKSPGYYIEKYIGYAFGIGLFLYLYCGNLDFIMNANLYDKMLAFSSTLFGFLLAILTLVVQSNSEFVTEMRTYDSYDRFIEFNKRIVFLSLIEAVLTLCLFMLHKHIPQNVEYVASCISLSIFFVIIVNTLIFLSIFYIVIKEK
ncbi:Uncharacterised protein [Myroides odoratimimus]|uniref:hypothetical protein n=1 Tax=Myroides odoratimimus TaxID=76832 RepID=UPI00073E61A1|nr:hypothetical protein [Myroides odoratimimus]STZ48389.1 Uncharacterised protein [Myroides odoratimimus]